MNYFQKERTVFKTDMVAASWKAVEKLLNSAELHLDGVIDKVDNLALDVELSRSEELQVDMRVNDTMVVTVGENEHVYGADLFEEYQQKQGVGRRDMESIITENKKIDKCR